MDGERTEARDCGENRCRSPESQYLTTISASFRAVRVPLTEKGPGEIEEGGVCRTRVGGGGFIPVLADFLHVGMVGAIDGVFACRIEESPVAAHVDVHRALWRPFRNGAPSRGPDEFREGPGRERRFRPVH